MVQLAERFMVSPPRRHVRLVATTLCVQLKVEGGPVVIGQVRNIGEGGMFVRTRQVVHIGTKVTVAFPLGDSAIEVRGEIVHAISTDEVASTPSGLGVRFLETEAEKVARVLESSGGPLPKPAAAHRPTIMVVDDDRDTRELLHAILEFEGYRVGMAPNGLRLMSTLAVDKPSAILLDIKMSWIDGFELCHALKQNEKLRDIPVLFISGCIDTAAIERGRSLGAVDYFTKPIDMDRLLKRLRQIVPNRTEGRGNVS